MRATYGPPVVCRTPAGRDVGRCGSEWAWNSHGVKSVESEPVSLAPAISVDLELHDDDGGRCSVDVDDMKSRDLSRCGAASGSRRRTGTTPLCSKQNTALPYLSKLQWLYYKL